MKDKIIAALKTAYASSGLSEKAFGGVASFLEKTITKEEEIEDGIKTPEVESLIKSIQGESDSLRTRNAQISKELDELKGKQNPQRDGKHSDDSGEDVNSVILAKIEALENAMKERDNKAKLDARIADIRKRLSEGGSNNENILGLVMKDAALSDDETDDKAVERLKSVYDTTFKQFYGDGAVPPVGNNGGTGVSHPDQSLIEALRRSNKLPAEQKDNN